MTDETIDRRPHWTAEDQLDLAIKQYAIYLGKDRTMKLYQNWLKAESTLSIWTEAELMLSYCLADPGYRMNDAIEAELLGRIAYAIESLNEIKSFFESAAEIETVSARQHRKPISNNIAESQYNRKGLDYVRGFFIGLYSESIKLILAADSRLPRVCLSRQLIEMRFLLVRTRLKLLEPVVISLSHRNGTKKKPRDTGSRALLQAALVADKTPHDLAKMLVEEGLAGGLAGSKGSLKHEKARLNSILWKLHKGR